MAKVKLLVDTDILIDYLKRVKPARELFHSGTIDIYCSILSKKELLIKPGLSSSAHLPLLTRNRKHFEHIKEIELAPTYKL